jgi:soluble lytic murein transglycosylase
LSRTLTFALCCVLVAGGLTAPRPGWAASVPAADLSAWLENLAQASQALADGDAASAELAARAALVARQDGGGAAARAELALGLALRDEGRFGEAAASLARAAPRLADPVLADHARFELAQAQFYGGHPGAAAALFAEVAGQADGPLARRARWREADALLEAGAPRLAARAYEALLAYDPGAPAAPGARLALASALRQAGEEAKAIATYRALWIEFPADPAGRAAGHALHLWRKAGGNVPMATPDDRLLRASKIMELALPRRVLTALDRLDAMSPPPAAAARSALLRAFALLQLGRREQAEARARTIAADPDPGLRAGAELVLARAAARADRLEEAAARYRDLAKTRAPVPGLSPNQQRDLPEDAAFLACWLYYDAGAYARAAKLLGAYARTHAASRRAEDARWFEAWSLYHLGRTAAARKALARLGRGALAPAALYWQARLARGAKAQRRLYRKVLAEAPPGSWYALLAAGRLAALGEQPPALPPVPPSVVPDGPGPGATGDALDRAARLLGAGLPGEAIGELRILAAGRGSRGAAPVIAQLAQAAGDADVPFRLARDQLAPSRRAQRWAYPLAFPDLLPAAAAEAGIDPYLYLAVMRRESSFRPDARSGAGAVGLVQLIPPTAERLGAVNGLPPSRVRELELPAVSVPLGAAYLALLTERFVDPAVVLAAYNGGPVAVGAWAKEKAGVPLDVWVEDIPFRETRHYVKNVFADAVMYRALWERGALSIDGERLVPAPREGVGF